MIDTDIEHPFFVTAADEAIATALAKGKVKDTLHFYRRDPPGISIGYFRRVSEDVDLKRCSEEGVVVLRRTSGGGTIFTDKNQLIYGLATGKRLGGTVEDSFKVVCTALVKALITLGVEAEYKPPNDIVVNGKKISGSAQSLKDNVTLMHGTVILDLDTGLMSRVLKEKKPGYVSSVKHETGLSLDVGELKQAIVKELSAVLNTQFLEAGLSEYENNLTRELIKNKYSSDEWNLKR